LVAPAPDKTLNRVLGDWKRFTSTQHGIAWQKNFIDHRIRSDENVEEKATYIRMNPFRAGLIGGGEESPCPLEHSA
jgi:putative transposase